MPMPPPTDSQARLMWTALTGLALATLVALIVALVWGLGRVLNVLAPVLWPLAIAGVLAYLLDPVVDWLERKRVPRMRGVILVFFAAALLIIGVFGSVVPQLVVQTRDLITQVPALAAKVEKRVTNWATNAPAGFMNGMLERFLPGHASAITNAPAPGVPAVATNPPVETPSEPPMQGTNFAVLIQVASPGGTNAVVLAVPSARELPKAAPGSSLLESLLTFANLKTATSYLSTAASAVGGWLLGQLGRMTSLFGVIAGLALVPVYLFYFLVEKRGITAHWTEYLPVTDSKFKQELVFVLSSINDYLIAFFRGQVLVAICDGILYGIGFALIGLPYAMLIGASAMVLTIIPYIGSAIVCATALVLALVQFGDWQHPALVLAVFAVVQVIEGLFLQPRIMGDKVGLHPVTIIIALMFGTTLLGGLLGGILAIPFAAALRVLMFRYIWRRPADAAAAGKDP